MTSDLGEDNTTVHPGKPRVPLVLATVICVLAVVPAILVGSFAVGSVVSVARTGIVWGQTWESILLLVLYLAGLLAFIAMRRSVTVRRTWITAGLAITLVGLASIPVVWVVYHGVTEEWCESQPGGRGGAPITSMDDIPAVCR
ncbi:hypothetical protein ACWG8W_01230 [Citricoccus zhacaiensis]